MRLEKTVGELPSDIGLTGIKEREKEMRGREGEVLFFEWKRLLSWFSDKMQNRPLN